MSETSFILASLALISALSLLLLSFFVMRIRREVIGINKKMSRIEELLIQNSAKQPQASASNPKSDDRARRLKVCENCGRKNALQNAKCLGCGELLQ